MFRILKITAMLTLLIFSGCGEDSAKSSANQTEQREPTVAIFFYNAQDVYLSGVVKSLEAKLSGRFKVIIEDAKGDQLTQNEQLDALLGQGVDVVLFNPVEPQASSLAVDLAQKADVPIIFFNREPDLDILKMYSKAAFVGTAVLDAGKLQGEIIRGLWQEHPEFDRNGDGKLQFVMFQGEPDNPEAVARTEFSIKRARELGVEIEQVGQTYICDWDRTMAYEAMKLVLINGIGPIEMVVSNNDTMALGAIDALQEIEFNKENANKGFFIPVIGVDAIPAAVEAIQKRIMSATVKQDAEVMAEAIAELTANAYEKRDFLEGTKYFWDESGVAVRIPYSKFVLDEN